MQPSLSDSVSRGIKNIQRVADLMLRSAASPRGALYSLTELFLLQYSARSASPMVLGPVSPTPAAPVIAHVKLAHTVLQTYENTLQILTESNFVPSTRAADFAAALTGETALSATQLQVLCDVSNDTATRWLNKAVDANLLRRIMVGKQYVYINVQHFALIQDLPISLSDIPSATGLKKPSPNRLVFANPAKYLDSYPPVYLESITPPF